MSSVGACSPYTLGSQDCPQANCGSLITEAWTARLFQGWAVESCILHVMEDLRAL